MRIVDVMLFERIVALNSVSAAGAAYGLSATVASERLKRLENSLGCVLLNRTTRSMSLTDEGARFLTHANDLIQKYEMTRYSVGKRSETPTGVLRVAAPALFGKKFLPTSVNAFLKKYPKTKLDLNLSDDVLDYSAVGIDVAIRIGTLEGSTRIARKLSENKRILCASPSYIDHKGHPSHPSDLKNHDCIIFIGEDHWQLDDTKTQHKIQVSGRICTNSAEMATIAALNGLGIALRSVWDVTPEINAGRLIHVLPNFEVPSEMSIYAIFPPGKFISPAARAFADLINEDLKSFKL